MSSYDSGFKKGRKDCKKGCRNRFQIFCLERRRKNVLTPHQMGYIDGYNCQMNNK